MVNQEKRLLLSSRQRHDIFLALISNNKKRLYELMVEYKITNKKLQKLTSNHKKNYLEIMDNYKNNKLMKNESFKSSQLNGIDVYPIKHAIFLLQNRVKYNNTRQIYYLDGRPTSLITIIKEANTILKKDGKKLIRYPGVY